jgi:hypothetical protein
LEKRSNQEPLTEVICCLVVELRISGSNHRAGASSKAIGPNGSSGEWRAAGRMADGEFRFGRHFAAIICLQRFLALLKKGPVLEIVRS